MTRGIPGSTPGHGTHARYIAGCRCGGCRAARAAYQKRSNYLRSTGRAGRLPSVGTARRLQALARLGWPPRELADRLGVASESVQQLRCTGRPTVERGTHERVAALYDELAMTPGPSVRARVYAERQGWAPPLAWDDDTIDDPAARPNLGAERPWRAWDGLERDIDILLSRTTPEAAADALGMRAATIAQAATRNGRRDLARTFWALTHRQQGAKAREAVAVA